MAAYVGFAIDDYGTGTPIAAGTDHDDVFRKGIIYLTPR